MKLHLSISLCIIAAILLVSTMARAEIYKWTDDSGRAHFSDSPPAEFKSESVEVKINTYSAVEIRPLEARLGRSDRVVMYTASWCGICKKAKRYFRMNNIPYKTYDVEKNRVGKMDFKLLNGRAVPIIIVGSKRMNGFTVARFKKLYEAEMAKKQKAEEAARENSEKKQ